LRNRNTFGIEAYARQLVETDDANDLSELFKDGLFESRLFESEPFESRPSESAPSANASAAATALVLGGGSNLLIVEGPHVALALQTQNISTLEQHEGRAIVRADAGVDWHRLVMWSLEHGFAGLENLALIPGTVGAAPIQNIGAYGVEVGQRIHAVEAFERASGTFRRFDAAQCAFAYRDSLFKQAPDRYLITAVEFALSTARSVGTAGLNIGYAGIAEELQFGPGTSAYTARDVAEAVIRLRRRKLPDPAVVGNAGSFFKNPIVPAAQAEALKHAHAALPVFAAGDAAMRKLSAAWLIDACGWKGHRGGASGDAGVSDRHALVLVNHGRASGAELLALAREIAGSVQARFGVAIEPEPRIVGAAW
jgi:UDP-N-acetylmuramate dehydrogenase